MSDSTIKVKLKEAEEDPKKQFEMLESSSLPQAIAVFGMYGAVEIVGELRMQHVRRIGARGHIREFTANKEGKVVAVDRLLAGCVPTATSTAALGAWVEKFVTLWAQVQGSITAIHSRVRTQT